LQFSLKSLQASVLLDRLSFKHTTLGKSPYFTSQVAYAIVKKPRTTPRHFVRIWYGIACAGSMVLAAATSPCCPPSSQTIQFELVLRIAIGIACTLCEKDLTS
jgi:hypothetical protein